MYQLNWIMVSQVNWTISICHSRIKTSTLPRESTSLSPVLLLTAQNNFGTSSGGSFSYLRIYVLTSKQKRLPFTILEGYLSKYLVFDLNRRKDTSFKNNCRKSDRPKNITHNLMLILLRVTNVEVPPRRNFRTILPRVLARARRLFSG